MTTPFPGLDMISRNLLLVPSLALIAACGSDGPTTVTAFDGALSFTYSGGTSGTFNASGSLPSTASGQTTTAWAAAQASATSEMFVGAVSPRSATTHDLVGIFIQRNTVGTETINSSCGFNCNGMDITIGMANSGSTFTVNCFLGSGSIAITEKSASRMKGTFSGTGQCMTSTGSAAGAFTVTNGTFDVAIVPDVP